MPHKIIWIKPWYLLVTALIFGVIFVAAMRANNLRMVELRQAVYAADEAGEDIETPLRKLREHVYGHMNTNLSAGPNAVHPPIQLKFTYERLVQSQQAESGVISSTLYTEAQAYCEQTIPRGVSGGVRIGCIQAYIKERDPKAAPTIPKSLYQFDFVSPTWSPDLAGWSLVAAVGSTFAAVFLWLYQRYVKHRQQ